MEELLCFKVREENKLKIFSYRDQIKDKFIFIFTLKQ